ncbi:MAG: 6-bladed beta-propeller [Bacilli bacterium]|nr:6-bladed beta-propeller [Bacilli bacterium]
MNSQIAIFKVRLNLLIPLLLLALFSCQNDSPKNFIIDLEKAIDVSSSKNSLSSLIESYNITQLETSSDCLIGRISKVVKVSNLFFIKTSGSELLVFDREGKYLRQIGNKGKGPGEYVQIADFSVSEDGSVVAISSYKDILFYRVDEGHFIKKQSLDYFVNSLCYLPNEELLVQVTQANFLIAHVDTEGNIINSFGSMNRVLELEQPFEFVKLDDSNFMYRIGETSDYYLYNYREKSIKKSEIIRGKNILKEQKLQEELVAAGPDGYRFIGDFLRNQYCIKYIKILGSDILVSYLYKEKSCILLFNPEKSIKKDFVFRPEKSSNLIDDVLRLSPGYFLRMHIANSDDNSILIYLYPEEYLKDQNSNSTIQSGDIKSNMVLNNSLKIGDNPLIIEYIFKEI